MGIFHKNQQADGHEETVLFEHLDSHKSLFTAEQTDQTASVENKGETVPVEQSVRPKKRLFQASRFGVEEANQLLKQLPDHDDDLMIFGVKAALESVGIDLNQVIQEAEEKAKEVKGKIHAVETEIEALEQQILDKTQTINNFSETLKELNNIKRRIEYAQNIDLSTLSNRQKTEISETKTVKHLD